MAVCLNKARSSTSFFRSAYLRILSAPFGPRESHAASNAVDTTDPVRERNLRRSTIWLLLFLRDSRRCVHGFGNEYRLGHGSCVVRGFRRRIASRQKIHERTRVPRLRRILFVVMAGDDRA